MPSAPAKSAPARPASVPARPSSARRETPASGSRVNGAGNGSRAVSSAAGPSGTRRVPAVVAAASAVPDVPAVGPGLEAQLREEEREALRLVAWRHRMTRTMFRLTAACFLLSGFLAWIFGALPLPGPSDLGERVRSKILGAGEASRGQPAPRVRELGAAAEDRFSLAYEEDQAARMTSRLDRAPPEEVLRLAGLALQRSRLDPREEIHEGRDGIVISLPAEQVLLEARLDPVLVRRAYGEFARRLSEQSAAPAAPRTPSPNPAARPPAVSAKPSTAPPARPVEVAAPQTRHEQVVVHGASYRELVYNYLAAIGADPAAEVREQGSRILFGPRTTQMFRDVGLDPAEVGADWNEELPGLTIEHETEVQVDRVRPPVSPARPPAPSPARPAARPVADMLNFSTPAGQPGGSAGLWENVAEWERTQAAAGQLNPANDTVEEVTGWSPGESGDGGDGADGSTTAGGQDRLRQLMGSEQPGLAMPVAGQNPVGPTGDAPRSLLVDGRYPDDQPTEEPTSESSGTQPRSGKEKNKNRRGGSGADDTSGNEAPAYSGPISGSLKEAASLNNQGYNLRHSGRRPEAEQVYQKAIAILKGLTSGSERKDAYLELAQAEHGLASIDLVAKRYAQAYAHYKNSDYYFRTGGMPQKAQLSGNLERIRQMEQALGGKLPNWSPP